MTIEIVLGTKGLQVVRILGADWSEGPEGHELLQHLNPLLQQLDRAAKEFGEMGERLKPVVC